MCLIAFAWRSHPDYDLIVAANRDEYHDRPALKADWWEEAPDVLAGKDVQAGGSWFAVTRGGRFATVTNYREQSFTRSSYKSRGELVSNYVIGRQRPLNFSNSIDPDDYAGFNLLTADSESLDYLSNRGDSLTELDPGIYGLSNASLDTPWSKLERTKQRLTEMIKRNSIDAETLMDLLADRQTADEDANSEHLPFEQAKAVTAPFIVTPKYGTRCSTVFLRQPDGESTFVERRFDSQGETSGESAYHF